MDQHDDDVVTVKPQPWWRKGKPDVPTCRASALQPGDVCPACEVGRLAYNGLFQLMCRRCGVVTDPGAFT